MKMSASCQQALHHLAAPRAAHVERDAALVAIGQFVDPVDMITDAMDQSTHRIAPVRLDLDHIRAKLAQQASAHRRKEPGGHLDDLEPSQQWLRLWLLARHAFSILAQARGPRD